MSAEPLRSEVKTIHLPSRENDALKSSAGLARKGFGLRPSASAMKISVLRGANPEYAIVYLGWAFIDSGVPAITHTARPRNNVLHAKCEAPAGGFRGWVTPSQH